jgi:hypothetical protein
MVIVTVHLASAISGELTEIGRMHISNVGGTQRRGEYDVEVMRRGTTDKVQRTGRVPSYNRISDPVWRLVAKALDATGFKP